MFEAVNWELGVPAEERRGFLRRLERGNVPAPPLAPADEETLAGGSFYRLHRLTVRVSVQALFLYLLAVLLYTYNVDDQPSYPHFFEENTITRELRPGLTPREALHRPPREAYAIFREWGNGDVDHVGFSFPWVLAVDVSRRLFGENAFGHRLPSALVSALSPVMLLLMIRRFFRWDVAFLAALFLATSPFQLTFARNGGYVGATLALLLALFYTALRVSIDDSRRAWLPLTLLLALVPYFYAPIRYLSFLTVPPILYAMAHSKAFRRRHLPCLAASLAVLALTCFPNLQAKNVWAKSWGRSLRHAVTVYFSGSGEHFFSITAGAGVLFPERPSDVNYTDPHHVFRKLLVLRLNQWWDVYFDGAATLPRVDWQARYGISRTWPPSLAWLEALGLVYCLWLGLRRRQPPSAKHWTPPPPRRRYLLPVVWSILTWLPLLVTNQVNGNRTMLGLPADIFFMSLGFVILVELLRSVVRFRLKPKPTFRYVCYTGLVVVLVWARVRYYFSALP